MPLPVLMFRVICLSYIYRREVKGCHPEHISIYYEFHLLDGKFEKSTFHLHVLFAGLKT